MKKVKNTVPWTFVISDHKRIGDKLYVKWKGYNNSFNSWIDKKNLI